MPTIPSFNPPAGLTDFDAIPGQREGWSKYISATFDRVIADVGAVVGAGKCQFYNETKVASDNPQDEPIVWDGFPRVLTRRLGRVKALQTADTPAPEPRMGNTLSRIQDEYCEWQVTRDPATNKILRVTFTCEGPEYWQSLAGGPSFYNEQGQAPSDFGAPGDKDVLVQLYRDLLNNTNIPVADLFFADDPTVYNPWNEWNTAKGIVHLQQLNNTLGAEIHIGADATVRRTKGGSEITESTRLICCGGFGVVERSSDPRMGIDVNTRARQGYALTLRDPVGIYFASDGYDSSGFTKPGPGGTRVPAGNYWKPIRGAAGMIVRAVYEVPAGELGPDGQQLTVSDLQIAGAEIKFGGQLAERIKMKFVARRCRENSFSNTPVECRTKCCSQNGTLQAVDPNTPCSDVFPVGTSGPTLVPDAPPPAAGIPFRCPSRRA